MLLKYISDALLFSEAEIINAIFVKGIFGNNSVTLSYILTSCSGEDVI